MIKFGNPLTGVERCPQCNIAKPLLEQRWATAVRRTHGGGIYWAAYECSSCNKITMAEGHQAPLTDYGDLKWGTIGEVILRLYPSPKQVDSNLPEDAQRYLKQAMETSFAPDASIIMAASSVDAMLKARGYTKGSLNARIDKAVSDHVLTDGMGKWAHRIRLDANAVRHADEEVKPPTEEDAKQVVEFASALGDFLYVFTARVEEGLKEVTPE